MKKRTKFPNTKGKAVRSGKIYSRGGRRATNSSRYAVAGVPVGKNIVTSAITASADLPTGEVIPEFVTAMAHYEWAVARVDTAVGEVHAFLQIGIDAQQLVVDAAQQTLDQAQQDLSAANPEDFASYEAFEAAYFDAEGALQGEQMTLQTLESESSNFPYGDGGSV